ncbi:MAG: Ppx/GppA family phosphatase [Planctomycetes bacterium]|nr:Ppx/GppA family phosphatase [Planctomycetota bacterium]
MTELPSQSGAGIAATPEPCRVATIDVGTNSVRLLVVSAGPDGRYRLLDDEKVVARIGRGMGRSARLADDAMEETARVISHMKAIAEGYDAQVIRAVATSAVREAANREDFLEMVRRGAGIEIEVISGEEEARLAWISVNHAFDLRSREVAVIDIGGGSTEIVLSAGGVIEQIDSLPVGAVRITEAVEDGLSPQPRLKRMRKLVRNELKAKTRKPATAPDLVIGTGGTFTSLAYIDMLGDPDIHGDVPGVRGHEITLPKLRRHLERVNAMTPQQRAAVPGLSADRADIIVAGLTIAEQAMMRLGASLLQVHDRGIRDGLLLRIIGELFPQTADEITSRPPDRQDAVRLFAIKCQYERAHSEHVTSLALQIFDQLVERLPDLPENVRSDQARQLLEAAAILHDIGYYINYTRHHKHSYHLVMHSELVGFSHRELEVIANVGRYHRRAHPKKSHPGFQRLSTADQRLVRHLAAILRIADGLDRSHAGNVRRVRVEVDRRTAWFLVEADRKPDVDLWGAARKSQLFARVFGMEPRFEPAEGADADADTGTDANTGMDADADADTDAAS